MFDESDFLATQASFGDLNQDPDDFVFSTEFFDLNAAASPPSPFGNAAGGAAATLGGLTAGPPPPIPNVNGFSSFGEAMDFGASGLGGLSVLPSRANGTGSVDALGDLGLPSAGMDGLMPTVEGTENLCVPCGRSVGLSLCVLHLMLQFLCMQVGLGNPRALARGRL